jgi:thiamine kinase-like enzyme
MREAFMSFNVVDFQSKDDFDNREFRKLVQNIFEEKLEINLSLVIHWQDINEPKDIVLNLALADGQRVKRDTPLQERIAAELEDLLCRLFHRAESILVRPMTSGSSGSSVLRVEPFFTYGGGQAVVVKFGNIDVIKKEKHNFMNYVQPFVGGARITTILDDRRTFKLGGIVYSLLGVVGDQVEDFGSFYKHADISQVRDVLGHIFRDTCGAWYANLSKLQPYNLTEDYQERLGLTQKKLEEAFESLRKSVQGKEKLHFSSVSEQQTFTNPILAVADKRLVRPTYTCTTHGDFNPQNILVDRDKHSWLIDFQSAGPGHIMRDVAALDSAVRYQLLSPEAATLDERLAMEQTLNQCTKFSELDKLVTIFPTKNQDLAKTFATVVHIRKLARQLIAQNPNDDMSEYYIALLYNGLNNIRFHSLKTVQREHALLSASLIAEKLGL